MSPARSRDTDDGSTASEIFWGEMQPCEHMVQLYASDEVFLDSLDAFVTAGLAAGDSVVLLATPEHLAALQARLSARGLSLDGARARGHFIAEDAAATLERFMVDDWPDEERFERTVRDLLARAGAGERRVRAFGEMVALLWAQGHYGATVHLEHLWHRLCAQLGFPLFCAYPRTGFLQDASVSVEAICAAHSRVLAA